MKIVLATPLYAPDWEWGGVVTWAAQLFPGLARRGHDVTVVTTHAGGGRFSEEEELDGVRVVRVRGEVTGASGRIRADGYGAACRKHFAGADVIHLAGVWQPTGHVAARAVRSAGMPYGISPHGALGAYAWTRNRWLKRIYYVLREKPHIRQAAWIHATAPMEEDELRQLGWKSTVRVVPNPLDTALWRMVPEEGRAWRQRTGLSEHEVVLLSCGRLHHKKGLDLLPEALAGVAGNWRWVVIGDDRNGVRPELEARLRAHKIEQRVLWLDPAPPQDVRAAYCGSDCLLMPSLHENFGNVAVEAAACGCPALVSDSVGAAPWLDSAPVARDVGLWNREIARIVGTGRGDEPLKKLRSGKVRKELGADRVAAMFESELVECVSRRKGGR
jgi:glycosyltransferase involved in cell wall biosynthesis